MADIEIDIVGGGIEIDISPTDIEVEIESNDVDITLSRIGPQGPPGESSDIFFSNMEILSIGSTPTTQPSEWSQDYAAGTVVYYMAIRPHDVAEWEIVGFPATLAPGVPRLATDPSAPNEGDVWFNTTEDVLKYYDGANVDVVADTKDLATFEDRTLPVPVEYRLDEIEYDTIQDGHQHEFLFKFENALGQIGEKSVSTQAPIADGRPATNANFTDDTDTQRYTTVATVKHWANNEFVEDSQVLDANDADTSDSPVEIVSSAWLKARWTPTKTPATGTVPDSWDNVGGGVAVTGDSGENIIGVTVTDGELVSVERGTIEAGDATVFSATRPTNPEANDRWVDLTTGRQYVYTVGTNASYWRQLSGLAQASAGEALALTASEIEAFFTDGSGDRGVTYAVANDEITTTVAADSTKQDNITLTAGTSGATFLNNVLDLSSLTPGDVTAAAVAALFNDSSASRGVSYSATSNNKIDTVVNADDTKQDVLTGEDIVTLINGQNTRVNTARIGTGVLNNAELNTLNNINTDENIQTQLDGKQASGDYLLTADETVKSVTVGSSGATFTSGALDLSNIMGGGGQSPANYLYNVNNPDVHIFANTNQFQLSGLTPGNRLILRWAPSVSGHIINPRLALNVTSGAVEIHVNNNFNNSYFGGRDSNNSNRFHLVQLSNAGTEFNPISVTWNTSLIESAPFTMEASGHIRFDVILQDSSITLRDDNATDSSRSVVYWQELSA